MTTKALLVRLEGRPGMDDEVEDFLVNALPLVRQESGTVAWFAIRFGRNEYGVFDAFNDEAARDEHLNGAVAKALAMKTGPMFVSAPEIIKLDVLADKLPTASEAEITKAILLTFNAKEEHETEVIDFLEKAKPMVQDEEGTLAWWALRFPDGGFGIFDVFADNGSRLKHLVGQVPRELAVNAFHLLGSLPELELLSVHAQKL